MVQNVHALGDRFEEYSKSLEKIGNADTTVLGARAGHCAVNIRADAQQHTA